MRLKEKRILVTGGAGFIGRNLTEKLVSVNASLVVFDNFSFGKRSNLPKNTLEIVHGNVNNRNDFKKIRDIDFVIHLASPSSSVSFQKNPESCLNTTINGFANVLEWSSQSGVEKIIYPSSGKVYDIPFFEKSKGNNFQQADLYGISKLISENLAKKYSDRIPSVGLRIFTGYGPGEDHKGNIASVITQFANEILADRSPIIYGNGNQKRDFVYVETIVEAMKRSMERKTENVVIDVGSGRSHSYNETVKLMNDFLDKKIEPRY